MTSITSLEMNVGLYLYGNAASHRRCWDLKMFLDDFKRSERASANDLWSARILSDRFILFKHNVDPKPLVTRFTQFVMTTIRQGLGSYTQASIYISQRIVNDKLYVLIRARYPRRDSYKIIVLAPDSAKPYVSTFSYLFEQMECSPNWYVNSITQYVSIRDGVHFDATESDACAMFNYLADEIESQLPDIMYDVDGTPLMDVHMTKCRRGNKLYIRFGIEWAPLDQPIEWGAAFPSIPISNRDPVEIDVPNDVCAICLDPLKDNLVRWGKCNHVFHLQCVKMMWERSRWMKCPLCRQNMDLQKVCISPPTESKKRRPVTRSMTKKRRRKLTLD